MTQAPIQPTISISAEQIAQFHENGFLAIEAITTSDEIEMLREVYDRLFEAKAGREEGNQFDLGGSDEDGQTAVLPQILNPAKYAPELLHTLYRANALAISRQLLGEHAMPMGEHAIFKPARYGAPTPWHQDEAYWNPQLQYQSLSVWLPLQPATLENGCMQFVPGSHQMEIIEHQSIGGDNRVHGLETVQTIDESKAVLCPLPPGGATFHLNRTLHYAGPNRSEIPRRAYILGFGLAPQPHTEPRSFAWNERKIAPRQERADKAKDEG